MKRYCLISQGVVCEIIPEFNIRFPGAPVQERYSPDILEDSVVVGEDVEVEQNWVYKNGVFTPPTIPDPVEPIPEPLVPTEFTILSEENAVLKAKLAQMEGLLAENSLAQQDLLEYLIEKGVI